MTNDDMQLREDLDNAKMLASDGLSSEALIQLRRIVHRAPDCAEAHSLIAALLCNQGVYDEALDAANRALELDPENRRALEIKQACEHAQEHEKPPEIPFGYRPGTLHYEPKKTKVFTRPCPHCGQEIHRGVQLCRHCGAYIGPPKWARKLGLGVLGVLLFVGLIFFVTSVLGTRSMAPLYFDAEGNPVEAITAADVIEDATGPQPAFRIGQIRWHPGSVFPVPVPADRVDQMYSMSHGVTFSGELRNLSDKHLGYALVVAHFYGRQTGNELGAAAQEVYNVTPGHSVPLDFGARISNRPGDCSIAIVDISYGVFDRAPAPAPVEATGSSFPWLRFSAMFVLSVLLLFGAARLQLACNVKNAWDFELKEDFWASVLMVPVVVICNFLIFFVLMGTRELATQGIGLGPIVLFAMIAPFILIFVGIGVLFKREFWGTMLIVFFYGCLFLVALRFMV